MRSLHILTVNNCGINDLFLRKHYSGKRKVLLVACGMVQTKENSSKDKPHAQLLHGGSLLKQYAGIRNEWLL